MSATNLPPGCSQRDIETTSNPMCEICGRLYEAHVAPAELDWEHDDCICPTCQAEEDRADERRKETI